MSVRDFASYLGVNHRSVSHWEAGVIPRPFYQQLLDICLSRCSPEEQARFDERPGHTQRRRTRSTRKPRRVKHDPAHIVGQALERDDMRDALATRDIATVFRILTHGGMSQRQLASMTQQSQSEISEILSGRRVIAYDLLARIADGLAVPRGLMGLAHASISTAAENTRS